MEQITNNQVTLCEASFAGRCWVTKGVDARATQALMREHNLPEIAARLLVARGIAGDEVAAFLQPSLRASLPDPLHLKDMDAASDRLASAIVAGEKVAIFGDYDVDGATSTALLMRYLRSVGAVGIPYIPDRLKEGYGPNTAALLGLKDQGAALVITVDCGTLSFEPLQAAHEAGLDVVVIDHHQGEARMPECLALVNPNRLDEESPHRYLAAVGVTFLLLVATHRLLKDREFFADHDEPDLLQLLDIVALGTVCDMVPLVGCNRAFVAQGLKIMAARGNPGIRTLLDMANVTRMPEPYHLGFILGPRINAGGRVGRADFGTRLLVTEDEIEARELATALDGFNQERKAIEQEMLEAAMAQASAQIAGGEEHVLVVADASWHPGIIGIIAGRLKERFHLPAVAIALGADGVGKSSARSVTGFDFGAAVIAAVEQGILLAGGGHAMAAGFSIHKDKLGDCREFLRARVIASDGALANATAVQVDATLSAGGVTVELVQSLQNLAPFGMGNPEPMLMIEPVRIVFARPVGENHLKLVVTDAVDGKAKLSVIAFRAIGTPLGDRLEKSIGKPLSLLGQLQLDHWQGQEKVSLKLFDAAIL